MDVFIGQLIGFAIIVLIIVKYVVPPVKKLMRDQQEQVRQQIAEGQTAAARLEQAQAAQRNSAERAAAEAAEIREAAEGDAVRIRAELKEQAGTDAARIRQHGVDQLELQRQQAIRGLEAELGSAAAAEANRKVREHLNDSGAQSASVDRFLDELEALAEGNSVDAKQGV